MNEEQKIAVGQEVASLVEVDNLLNELDPEFSSNLGKINQEIGQLGGFTGLESITLSAEYLKASSEGKVEEIVTPDSQGIPSQDELSSGETFLKLAREFLWITFLLVPRVLSTLLKLGLKLRVESPISVIKKIPTEILPLLTKWFGVFQTTLNKLRTYSLATYIRLTLIVFLLFAIRLTLLDMKNRFRPDQVKDPFLKNWADVADKSYFIPADAQGENIDDPLRHPEYTVMIHKIVANLKPPNRSAMPMVMAELYIEVSNQDAAIEVRDRELEVRDSLERVFEGTTFDELDTKEGKEKLKIHIRSDLDQLLNKGHVKRVFFSAFNIVP